MAWLAIDLGEARVGLALSDPEHTLAHPAGNIQVHGDAFEALDATVQTISQHGVDRVFIGIPLLLDGSEGRSARKARRWANNLRKRLESAWNANNDPAKAHPPEISMVDERLTTVSAHRQLREAALDTRRHRPMIDQQSAVLILQSVLDKNQQV